MGTRKKLECECHDRWDIERGSKGGVINFDVNQRGRFEPQGNAHGAMSKVEWEEETYGKSC